MGIKFSVAVRDSAWWVTPVSQSPSSQQQIK